MLLVIYPKICSTLTLKFDFERLEVFCTLVNGWFLTPFSCTSLGQDIPVDTVVLTGISKVGIEFLACVLTIDERFKFLGIMNICTTDSIGADEFCVLISFDMIFVTVKKQLVLFNPTSIDVFLAEFIGLLFPCFRCFTGFYFFVFLPCIALSGNFYQTGIDYLACISKDTLVIKCLVETIE